MTNELLKQRRLKLLFLLWGLLFTKCFSLEYLVRQYEAPINSLYYVWCLSIAMATVATVVYGRLESASIKSAFSTRAAQLQLVTTLLAASSVAWTLLNTAADSTTPLFLAAILCGIRQLFSLDDSLSSKSWLKTSAWITTAIAIFFMPPPTGYILFALGLLLISVLPRAAEILRKTEK